MPPKKGDPRQHQPSSKGKGGQKKSAEDKSRGVHFEGTVEKCSKKFGFDFWQARWFVLTDTKFGYFKSRDEAASAAEGGGTFFSLGSVKGFTSGEGPELLVQTEGRELNLRGRSEGERDTLLRKLEAATRLFRLADYGPLLGGDEVGGAWQDRLLPAQWRGETMPFAITKVFKESEEWERVARLFSAGQPPLPSPLARVNRIQNRDVLRRFRDYRLRLSDVLAGEGGVTEIEERWVWHGTRSADNVIGIASRGFDASESKAGVDQYGKGSYFSLQPELAVRYAARVSPELASLLAEHPERVVGRRCVLLVRLVVGDVAQGRFDAPKPPVVVYSPSKRRADTLVDSEENPTILVSTHTAQTYPAYLVTLND